MRLLLASCVYLLLNVNLIGLVGEIPHNEIVPQTIIFCMFDAYFGLG